MLQVSVPIAHELLAQCVKQGQALVQRASLVGDFSDYESWKSARKQWIEPTAQALEHMYGGSKQAREFTGAVTPADGGQRWQQQYATDLPCVEAAIDFLTVLQGELAFERPGESSPGAAELTTGGARAEQIGVDDHSAAQDALDDAQGRDAPGEEPDDTRQAMPESPPAPGTQPGRRPAAQAPPAARADEWRTDREPAVGSQLAPSPIVGAELAQHSNGSVSAERTSSYGPMPARARQVFLAHGRNENWKEAVARLLAQAGSHEITILNEPSERGTLVEQFGEHAPGSRYAVVLLTADDVGAPRLESEEEPYFSTRARQGVVFEMGFLVAALTPGCVCVLYEDGVELPCDLDGISYVRLDLAGTWQPKLLLHLRKAGFDYDLNKLVSV
jgi:predicted nucleotide-binding protein